jgi:hypothetical protein
MLSNDYPTFDMSRFIEAASKNSDLQSLKVAGAYPFTAESLGRLRLHPNLMELGFSVSLDTELSTIEMFKQIIETCPMLQKVQLVNSEFTRTNWPPICNALYKIQSSVSLDLFSCKI